MEAIHRGHHGALAQSHVLLVPSQDQGHVLTRRLSATGLNVLEHLLIQPTVTWGLALVSKSNLQYTSHLVIKIYLHVSW